MGTLYWKTANKQVPLRARCVLGRHAECDVHVDASRVSGAHASLRWMNDSWELKDLGSRNGTFVAGRRLAPGESTALEVGATFSFSRAAAEFELSDASPPSAAAFHEASGAWRFAEGGLLALPSDEQPLVTVFMNGDEEWMIERPDGLRSAVDGETILVDGSSFRLELPAPEPATEQSGADSLQLGSIHLKLAVTPDEEQVDATVLIRGQTIRLPPRRYHYLLVTLARAWLADEGASQAMRGWVDRDDLCKKLQMDVMRLNMEIHRARKQFASLGIQGAAGLVERRFGTYEIRLGLSNVEVVRS